MTQPTNLAAEAVTNTSNAQRSLKHWHTPKLTILDIEQTQAGSSPTNPESFTCKPTAGS